MLAKNAELLTAEQIQTIHEVSLTILEEVGLQVHNAEARQIYREHGCRVEGETGLVRFPPEVVEHWRQVFPAKFRFFGRDPKFDRTLPDDGPLISTTGIAPFAIDLESGERRLATTTDIAQIAHLANELPGIDLFYIPTLAADIPEDRYALHAAYLAASNCLKPIRCGVNTPADLIEVLRLGEAITGGAEAYQERPFLYCGHTAVISPLTLDNDSTAVCIEAARRGVSAIAAIVPNGGLTAPLTLAGTLALANAEFLAINILAQMVREGAPVLFYSLPTTADLRSGAYAAGGIETGILQMGIAQLAHHYGVPASGFGGATNAKLPDAQSGFENGLVSMAGVLGGLDMVMLAGLIDGLLAFSYPQLVIDSEIGEMIKRVQAGVPFDEEHLALQAIREVGPGGMYIEHPHTFAHMRTAAYHPKIADRQSWSDWEAEGGLDTEARALRRVREILAVENPVVFSVETDRRIRARFPDLVGVELG